VSSQFGAPESKPVNFSEQNGLAGVLYWNEHRIFGS